MTGTILNGDASPVLNEPAQDQARRLIRPLISADSEERVKRTAKQWNQSVREHIRSETGLKLADGDARNAISVEVAQGFSISLARLICLYDDPILWRIIVGQPKIAGVIEGVQYLLDNWCDLQDWNKLPPEAINSEAHLRHTLDVAHALQRLVVAEEVRMRIQEFDEDILGVYRVSVRRVELYWMPIAMIAAMLDVRLEDLTVVTLTHELAHGYTHVGRDIDGHQWSDLDFRGSDIEVKEGLAQFYTEGVLRRLAVRTPGPFEAYRRLLNDQSAVYKVHLNWMTDRPQQRGEIVRAALISARSQGATTIESWHELLKNARNTLPRTHGNGSRRHRNNLFDQSCL